MSFFNKFKLKEKAVRVAKTPLTFSERVQLTINEQMSIATGETILNPKGNPKKSWFDEKKGEVKPKVGIYPLFGEKPLECSSKTQFIEILGALKNWENDNDLKPYFAEVEKKEKERNEARKKK